MALSKTTRIKVMLAIDIVFFLVELISGFAVGSLALMADAFHMLNDIISLLVGLWAVSVASKESTDKYSFGWLRAEILGAFFNAVFLIALCVSILLEALTRFIDPPKITSPVLILIVGCFGLASNLVGFVVLGGHGHSHGSDDHGHGGEDGHSHDHDHAHHAEEGRMDRRHRAVDAADENGAAIDVIPEVAIARARATAQSPDQSRRIAFEDQAEHNGTASSERCASRTSAQLRGRERRRTSSMRHSRLTSIDDISIHPSSFRQDIIAATRSSLGESPMYADEGTNSESEPDDLAYAEVAAGASPTEDSPLLAGDGGANAVAAAAGFCRSRADSHKQRQRSSSGVHKDHCHNQPKSSKQGGGGGHGHSHGDMGMNAMVLHVIGDALGNIGVIVTALIIWLTDWPGKYYADPAVSLFITLIILRSAVPLTLATSKVLLQATPDHIAPDEVRRDIEALDGVVSCHHVHIWQLSDTKIVASMHIQVNFPISEKSSGERYMVLAREARRCLHAYGIHSATIQPEFWVEGLRRYGGHGAEEDDEATQQGLRLDGPVGKACLLECVDDCVGQGCCSVNGSTAGSSRPASVSERL